MDCVILGPSSITQTEAEAGLGIESWQYSRSVLRKSDTSSQSEERTGWRHPKMTHSSPEPRRSVRLVAPDERSHERSHERPNTRSHGSPHERTPRALRSPDPGHGLRLSPEPKFCIDQGTSDEKCHHLSYLLYSGSSAQPKGNRRRQGCHRPDRASSRRTPTPASGPLDEWKSPDLHSQFELFSKFANASSDGTTITLRKLLSIKTLLSSSGPGPRSGPGQIP